MSCDPYQARTPTRPSTRPTPRRSPKSPSEPAEEPNPWLKEGADAPDAADIEDPDEQR